MSSILLVGGGGHCLACIDVIEAEGKHKVAGIVERNGESGSPVLGYEILGNDDNLTELIKKYPIALITVGQIKSADLRMKLFYSLKEMGTQMPIVLSPHAYISKHTTLLEGTIVMHGAIINAGSSIGENCIINTQALIEHDAVVESHCHISTGAKVNGGVFIGKESFVGSGTVIHEGVKIGEKSVITAGSIICKDMPLGTFYLSAS